MIRIDNLISHLPYYFKEKDTYKDSNGKGILERFLDVIGGYITDEILAPLDNKSIFIDLDESNPRLVNFIWELFGFIPYSYGVLLDNSKWNLFDKGKITEDNWVELISDLKPRAEFRDLLKYCISIFKIKGTLDFYPQLLKFYGYTCEVVDLSGDFENPQSQYGDDDFVPEYDDTILNYDEYYTYDLSDASCVKCKTIGLNITINHDVTDGFLDRLYLLLNKYRPVYITQFDSTNVTITEE